MEIVLRQEINTDFKNVKRVVTEAFEKAKYSDHKEHILVERLRNSDAFIPELSIVAENKGKILGHILLTKIKISNEDASFNSLALAPVSVDPDYQKKGIGSLLIRESHRRAKDLGFKSIVVLGHAKYYPRFGYQISAKYEIRLPFEVPEENCMVIELVNNGLTGVTGTVEYPKEFH